MTDFPNLTGYKRIQEIIQVENQVKNKSNIISKIVEEENKKIMNNIPYDGVKGKILDFTI